MVITLSFVFSYVQPITQHYKQRLVQEVPQQSIQSLWRECVCYKHGIQHRKLLHATTNQHLVLSVNNGLEGQQKVSVHYMYFGILKGTCDI